MMPMSSCASPTCWSPRRTILAGASALPTCRAGRDTQYCNGDDEAALAQVGWYGANSEGRLHAVAELQPNASEAGPDASAEASPIRLPTPDGP